MMIIRKPKPDEVIKVQQFMLGVIKNDFGYDYNRDWHWDINELEATYMHPIRSLLLVASEDEQIVGTIGARPYDKNYPEFVNKYSGDDTLGIWRHYIKKELRGQGIGKQMYKIIEDFAKKSGYKNIYLHTQKTIPGSMKYWQKRGFQITFEKDDEWQTVHMEKKIQPWLGLEIVEIGSKGAQAIG